MINGQFLTLVVLINAWGIILMWQVGSILQRMNMEK